MVGRIEFVVILRMDRSPPAAPHLASRRRSCIQLQAGERLPGEDFHLSDHVRFRAHECGSLLPLLKSAYAPCFSRLPLKAQASLRTPKASPAHMLKTLSPLIE